MGIRKQKGWAFKIEDTTLIFGIKTRRLLADVNHLVNHVLSDMIEEGLKIG